MQAMQLMQSDPKAAAARFQSDPDVSAFLREFGAVMSSHFDGISTATSSNQSQQRDRSNNNNPIDIIEVHSSSARSSSTNSSDAAIGPLHAQAIELDKQNKQKGGVTTTVTAAGTGR